jgi:hypothetical protein
MTTKKAIEMIDEYLLEPNNIDKMWVEVLELCKEALMKVNSQQTEIERLKNAYKQCAWERDAFLEKTE